MDNTKCDVFLRHSVDVSAVQFISVNLCRFVRALMRHVVNC